MIILKIGKLQNLNTKNFIKNENKDIKYDTIDLEQIKLLCSINNRINDKDDFTISHVAGK